MRKSTDTREKLLDTAITLIWQSNYHSVGVAEICKHAGVTKGSFYHYFVSKAELFSEAGKHFWENLVPELNAVFSPSCSLLEQLEQLTDHVINNQIQNASGSNPVAGCPFVTSAALCDCDEELVRLTGMEMFEKSVGYYISLVRELKAEGMLNGDPEPQQLGRMMLQYIQGLLTYGRLYKSLDKVREDLREGFYRILDLKSEYRVVPQAGDEELASASC
jgi:TetR/AcrR family transcriptional repressor of nem operon